MNQTKHDTFISTLFSKRKNAYKKKAILLVSASKMLVSKRSWLKVKVWDRIDKKELDEGRDVEEDGGNYHVFRKQISRSWITVEMYPVCA